MELQSNGNIDFNSEGFCLRATDGERKIKFILPEALAIKVFGFDVHGADLLERTVRDHLPEVWYASRRAYVHAPKAGREKCVRIDLAEEDFAVESAVPPKGRFHS